MEMPYFKMLHLENSFVRCSNLDTSRSGLEYLEGFEMWCWNEGVKNEEVLQRGKEERNILYTIT